MSPRHLHVCSLTPSIWWSCSDTTHYTVGFRILDYIKLYPRDIPNICLNYSILTTPSPSFSHLKFKISPWHIPMTYPHLIIYIPYFMTYPQHIPMVSPVPASWWSLRCGFPRRSTAPPWPRRPCASFGHRRSPRRTSGEIGDLWMIFRRNIGWT